MTAADRVRAESELCLAMQRQYCAEGNEESALRVTIAAVHLEQEARLRELEARRIVAEDAEIDAMLDSALSQPPEPSGVRVAPGLESLRARISRVS